MNSSNSLIYKIALSRIDKIGPNKAKNLIAYCGGARQVFDASKRELEKIPGIGSVMANKILNSNTLDRAEEELLFCETNDIQILDHSNPDFPFRLKQIDSCPLLLFKKGTAPLNANRTVGIIGTRKPTEYGKILCEKLVENLKVYEVTTISGLAYGIDAVCHKKSVEQHIPTIGVLGHGLDIFYPANHRSLGNKMLKNGALLTYFQSQSRFDKENFPARNRIVAALCDVLVVIESGRKGGSIITANFANEYSRDVFAFPGRIGDKYSEGCNKLIKQNKAHLIESVEDIAYIMRWEDATSKPIQGELFVELDPEEKSVVEMIQNNQEIGIDRLTVLLEFSPSKLASLLLSLEFKGVVRTLPGKKYIIVS